MLSMVHLQHLSSGQVSVWQRGNEEVRSFPLALLPSCADRAMAQTVPSAVLGPSAPAKASPTSFPAQVPPWELQQGQHTVLGAPRQGTWRWESDGTGEQEGDRNYMCTAGGEKRLGKGTGEIKKIREWRDHQEKRGEKIKDTERKERRAGKHRREHSPQASSKWSRAPSCPALVLCPGSERGMAPGLISLEHREGDTSQALPQLFRDSSAI